MIAISSLALAAKCPASLDSADIELSFDDMSAASLGSAAHAAIAEYIAGNGPDLSAIAERWEVSEDELRPAAGWAARVWDETFRELFPHPVCERRIVSETLSKIAGEDVIGHVDVMTTVGDEVRILDWKFGRAADKRDHWPNMRAYALSACDATGATRAVAGVARYVDQSADIREWSRDELEHWARDTFFSRIVRNRRVFSPGGHCGAYRCKRRHSCPAHKEMVRLTIESIGSEMTVPADEWLERIRTVENACEDARAAIRARVELDGPIPLPDGRELALCPRTVRNVDPSKAIPIARKYIGEDELAECVKISLPKLENAYRASPDGQTYKSFKAAKESLMMGLGDAVTEETYYTLRPRESE